MFDVDDDLRGRLGKTDIAAIQAPHVGGDGVPAINKSAVATPVATTTAPASFAAYAMPAARAIVVQLAATGGSVGVSRQRGRSYCWVASKKLADGRFVLALR
jgi:hypothetical protein